MKQLLFILLTCIIALNNSHAKNVKSYENTTWNVIRERLFNGENPKAYRFEEDIHFQLSGAKTQQDSAIVINMIAELNDLLEIVKIEMVDTDPNYTLTIRQHQGYEAASYKQLYSGSRIVSVNLELGLKGDFTDKNAESIIYYYTIRQLTRLYTPKSGITNYGGIFDSSEASDAELKEIDKDLLNKLYSSDFYSNLKENTVQRFGYRSYLSLRYKQLISSLSYSLKAILVLFGFMFFLSKASKRKPKPGLLLYLRQRLIILLIAPFIISLIQISDNSLPLLLARPDLFMLNFLIVVVLTLLGLIFIYYTEPVFLKKINNFFGKQIFIFFNTIFTILIVLLLYFILFYMFSPSIFDTRINLINYMNQDTTMYFLIAALSIFRIFYNFTQYRIQSLVNQKDVEIAKMKELKNQAELNALHSRINPHFLYNSLNSIATLAHIDVKKTENMATGLSELFRYSINKENKTFVTVTEELEMVEKYLEIEKTRFGNKLIYKIDADKSTLEKQIPKFLIQPLVENAIKHGLSKIKSLGEISIEIKQEKKDMTIKIFDNGPDFPTEPISGYGLQNLHDKLDILYGKNAIINWENGASKHFKITLKNQFES